MRLKIFESDIHGRLVAKVYKSLSLRQHGTLKEWNLEDALVELKAENIRQNQSMDRKATGGDADGF